MIGSLTVGTAISTTVFNHSPLRLEDFRFANGQNQLKHVLSPPNLTKRQLAGQSNHGGSNNYTLWSCSINSEEDGMV